MKNLVAAAAAFAVAGCATASAPPRLVISPGWQYVSMGSSFAAGAGIGPIQPGTPQRCGRTTNNYASLLAQRLHLQLVDVGCGGAMTAHVLGAWNELPAQIEAVTSETRLVTITIGGNDIGYVGGLTAGGCRAGAAPRPGGCPPKTIPTEDDYRKLESALLNIAHQVSTRAPKAKLVFVQYVTLVPTTLCPATALPIDEADTSRTVGVRLAEITARVARASGAAVLPMDQLSRTHHPCSTEPWSNGLGAGFDMRKGNPWHPNAAGHEAIAQALADLISP